MFNLELSHIIRIAQLNIFYARGGVLLGEGQRGTDGDYKWIHYFLCQLPPVFCFFVFFTLNQAKGI